MKLWHSFKKELILASRGLYFYIEIVMAFIFVFLLLFVIPENFSSISDEYIHWDVPEAAREFLIQDYLEADEDGQAEVIELELDDAVIPATLYQTDEKRYYVIDDEQATIQLADTEREFAAVVHMDDQGEITYTYYLQGYETERLRNMYLVFHNEDIHILEDAFDAQEVRVLESNDTLLSDRENVMPSFLTFNGSLMGLFIIAAYIFLDKQEGVIKAYAVTPSRVATYLLSKVAVIMVTSTITSLVIVLPVMGLRAHYPLLLVFLLTTGFFASALGLLLTSFYDNITQAFGMLYVLVIGLMLPNIAYFIPSWDPAWMKLLPSYPMLQGFKEILLPNPDAIYVVVASSGFLLAGLILFLIANMRFKKTLTV